MSKEIGLPEMPEGKEVEYGSPGYMEAEFPGPVFTADQMREYALEAQAMASPAITNKATEEGELLNALEKIAAIEDKSFGGDWDEIEEAREIARQAIAADRASRQVANKAEVEGIASSEIPEGWPTEIWLNAGDEDLAPFSEYDELSWCSLPQGENDIRYVREDLLDTPPATTGASTVLTDERKYTQADMERYALLVRDAAIEREVAAQAGQVAVPDDVADAKRYRWLRDTCYDTDPAGEGDAWDHPSLHFESSELEPYNNASLDAAIDADMNPAPSPAKEST